MIRFQLPLSLWFSLSRVKYQTSCMKVICMLQLMTLFSFFLTIYGVDVAAGEKRSDEMKGKERLTRKFFSRHHRHPCKKTSNFHCYSCSKHMSTSATFFALSLLWCVCFTDVASGSQDEAYMRLTPFKIQSQIHAVESKDIEKKIENDEEGAKRVRTWPRNDGEEDASGNCTKKKTGRERAVWEKKANWCLDLFLLPLRGMKGRKLLEASLCFIFFNLLLRLTDEVLQEKMR